VEIAASRRDRCAPTSSTGSEATGAWLRRHAIAEDMGRTLRFARGLRPYVLRSESLHHRHARACRTKRKSMIATPVQSIEETPRKAVGSRNAGRAPMPDHVGPSTQPGEIECEVLIGVGGHQSLQEQGRVTARASRRDFFSGERDFQDHCRALVSVSRINSRAAPSSNQRAGAFISTKGVAESLELSTSDRWRAAEISPRNSQKHFFSVTRCVRIHSKIAAKFGVGG
jgi:hypothetical protein